MRLVKALFVKKVGARLNERGVMKLDLCSCDLKLHIMGNNNSREQFKKIFRTIKETIKSHGYEIKR